MSTQENTNMEKEEKKCIEKIEESSSKYNAAKRLLEQGKPKEALEILEPLWMTDINLYGEQDPNTLVVKYCIGLCHYVAKDFEQAKQVFEQVLEIMEKVLGKEHEDTLRSKAKLASCLEWLGQHGLALSIFSELMAIQKKIHGEDDIRTKQTRQSIAQVLMKDEKFQESLEVYKTILPEQIKDHGHDDKSTIALKENMALVYLKLGLHDEAMALLKEIHATQEKLLGKKHPDTVSTRFKIYETWSLKIATDTNRTEKENDQIAKQYTEDEDKFVERLAENIKKYRAAETFLREKKPKEALDILEPLWESMKSDVYYGEENQNTLVTQLNIGRCHWLLKDYEKGTQLLQNLLPMMEKVFGNEDDKTISTRFLLASCIEPLSQKNIALETMKEFMTETLKKEKCEITKECAKQIAKDIKQEEQEANVIRIHIQAHDLMSSEKCKEARDILEPLWESMKSDTENFGEHHPTTLETKYEIGMSYFMEGEYQKCLEILEDVLEWNEKVLGGKHEKTILTKFKLGYCLDKLGRRDDAWKILKEVLTEQKKVFGDDDLRTGETEEVIAKMLAKDEKFYESLEIYNAILPRRIKEYGPDGKLTIEIKDKMANVYDLNGQHEEALTLYKEILASKEKVLGTDHKDTKVTLANIDRLSQKSHIVDSNAGGDSF